ncbi:MAG: molecular chaperone DnaK [bacterium]
MGKSVGIDFGTTNSVIAVMEGAEPVVLPNERGGRLTPSVVAFGEDGEIMVGAPAKNQAILRYERVISSVKRKMGTDFSLEIDDNTFSASQIASLVIGHMKRSAEAFLDDEVENAVITVPAYFNDAQRNGVRKAGEMAGLNVLRLINEPTAAALAYGLHRGKTGTIAVFDLGGGTFDISILDVSKNVYEVVATRGNNHLGGDDFDARLILFLCDSFYKQHKIDLREDRMALQKVREAAEAVKIELSSSSSAVANLPFISADSDGPKHMNLEISRGRFEEMIGDYLDEISGIVDSTLDDAGLEQEDVDEVLLVGGSTRIPAVVELLESKFRSIKKSVHPDEAVALGAAIQAGILIGDVKGLVLVDVTALSVGIETENDVYVPIIERNSCIPISKKRTFTTVMDNQSVVEVRILQGERPQASKNFSIGSFILTGVPPAKRGEPKIEVEFDIDADGLVNVTATETASGVFNRVRLDPKECITDEKISRVLEEAEVCKQEDSVFIHETRTKQRAKTLMEHLRVRMLEHGTDWLDSRPGILESLELFEDTMGEGDIDQIEAAMETLKTYIEDVPAQVQ